MPGLTWDVVDQANREEASGHMEVDKATAIALVRETVATAATVVRGLTDEQLTGWPPMTCTGERRSPSSSSWSTTRSPIPISTWRASGPRWGRARRRAASR